MAYCVPDIAQPSPWIISFHPPSIVLTLAGGRRVRDFQVSGSEAGLKRLHSVFLGEHGLIMGEACPIYE